MAKYYGTTDVKKIHYNMEEMLDEKTKKKILKDIFFERVGYELNIDSPKTFNEKIMWLKLYYQDPLITKCADKYAVKEYVKELIGEKYVVKTLASWENPEEIDFDKLPNQFVLKVNWSSGYNIVVKDKHQLNQLEVVNQLKRWIEPDRNSYYQYFNWGYKHMKPVIYAEEYLEQIDGQVYDYKFYFSNGKFIYMFIATDRHNKKGLTYTFFDENLNPYPFTYGDKPNADPIPKMPKTVNKMLELAKTLAGDFPFVRIDFYEINEKDIYLGEMTFYSGGGTLRFEPNEWDRKLGDKIHLPEKKIIDKETLGFKFKGMKKRMTITTTNFFNKCRSAIIQKGIHEEKTYLVLFKFLRIPYETHVEYGEKYGHKYISILGLEFSYKKVDLPTDGINSDIQFEYKENTPIMAYQMESMMTYDIQRIHCEQKAYKQLGYFPNLKNPETLNEKIIWLALNYKNPNITVAVDKGRAKEWIGSRVGYEHVVPLIGIYTDVNDIDFDQLPNQFVAKLNDGWGADEVMIVRDKSALNIDRTKAILSSWLYPWRNYYYQNMCITDEKMEKSTIVIEELLDDGTGSNIEDYKIYCCNGEPRFALVVEGRGTDHQTRSFVDMDWNVLPVTRRGKKAATHVEKPENLEKMLDLSRTLSKGFPFVRIDFYDVNGQVYVGEMTFTPGMFLRFSSKAWDKKLGDYLELPKL